ncbi:MAG: DUF6602 domain-containing protein [Planctomycetota bacterium]
MAPPVLPDASEWFPREAAKETIRSSFLRRSNAVEQQILLRSELEREMNIDNFDAGTGVEDIVRDELRRILPSRYSVSAGVLVDRNGMTSGDCDCVVWNDLWFPQVKSGAVDSSRRAYFPIEGVYAIGEIKQTLSYNALDEAMRKLVISHRLARPRTCAKRLVENRESTSCRHGLSNPLYSFILATRLENGQTFPDLINRFYDVCKQVKRLEVVRAMCVLGHGTVVWGFRDIEAKEIKPALFMLEDLYDSIVPCYAVASEQEPALFTLFGNLFLHLFHSVLAPEDFAIAYGSSNPDIKTPNSPDIALPPDPDWMDSLQTLCDTTHESS